MKFKDLRERVKGGKLDPLSKMGKSKLTGQEIAMYYRKNPKAKQAARDPMVKKAIELALDLGGNQTLAVKEIEKMKRGLSKNPAVVSALRTANEEMTSTSSVAMPEIPLGKVLKRKKDLEEQTLVENKVRYQTFFGKDRMGVTATAFAEYTKYVAKKFKIKIVKTPNPKGPNHLTFEAPEKDMRKFQQHLKKNLVKNAVDYIQKKNAGEPYKESLDESVGTITIDFSKASNSKKAKEKTIAIAKRYMIKVGKPKKPQSKDDVAFTGSKQALKLFGKEFNLAGRTGLLEASKNSLEKKPHEEKISKVFKTKNPVEIKGIDRLIDMSSIGVVKDMQKQNPRGFTKTVMSLGKLKESINEETILYRVKDIQKPELDKFKSSARLMKLKINIKKSPRGKETIIRLEGGKKQIRDFDAVARGKSSYGDPSIVEDAVERAKELADLKAKHKREVEQEKDEIERTKQSASAESVLAQLDALEEQIDLIEQSLLMERQFRLNPNKKPSLFTQWYSKKNQKDKRTRNMAKSMYSPEDVLEYHWNAGNLKVGKNIVKDTGASVLARSLGKVMNDERKKARDKGAEFGKGRPQDEMDAPKIKKIIDTISKGLIINVKKKGGNNVSFEFDKKQGDLFYNLDTYTRDIVWDIMQMGSDGTFYQAVYGEPEGRQLNFETPPPLGRDRLVAQTESTELNEESATMKKVRQVIKKKSMMNIDGMKLDLTTASMIASVYDKVNPQNKKRMDSLKLPQLVNLTMKVAGKARKESTELQEGQTYKSLIQGLEKDKKEVASKSKAFRQNDTKYIDKAINFLKMLEKEGIPAGQIGQVDFVTNRVPKFFIGPANRSPSLSKFTPNDVKKAVAHAKRLGIIKESTELPFSLSILERMSGIQNKSTDFIKVPKLNSKEQSYMKKIKKRFPKLPEPVNYEIMRLTHKGNQVDSKKYVEIGNLYDKDYKGGTGGKFIQTLRNMGARLPQGHMGEAVSPAQQAAIAISKKERGEKPKKDESLDAKDKPFVKDLIKKLRGGSKTHAKQADDLEKAMNTENRAKRDAMRDMGTRKDKEDDGYGTATDDDRKAADKNVIMQIRRVADLPKGGQIELPSGKKVKMDRKSAIALNKKFDSIRKPQDKLKLQKMMNDKKISVVALKRLLGK